MRLEGLTDFQNDLLRTVNESPKATRKLMQTVGNKAKNTVSRRARREVNKKKGNYHKKWKRGKVFKGNNGKIVVRVINSSPHAHLIEDGHRQVTKDGRDVGFVPGKKVLERGIQEFENNGGFEKEVAKALDNMLSRNQL